MRKLPARAVKVKRAASDENVTRNVKAKVKKSPTKGVGTRSRPALADKTNSGSDNNRSTEETVVNTRSRKNAKIVVSQKKGPRPKFVSTPLVVPKTATKSSLKAANTPFISPIEKISPRKSVEVKKPDSAATRILNFTASSKKDASKTLPENVPVYKNKLINHNDSELNVEDKNALYDFQYDPSEEPKTVVKKKKPTQTDKPKTQRKKTRKLRPDDEAMKNLLVSVERIKNAKLFQRLQAIKRAKQLQNEKDKESVETCVDKAPPVESHKKSLVECVNDDFDCGMDYEDDEQVASPHPVPVASSSLNHSHSNKPPGSPWRLDFDVDTKKWRYNFYIKPSSMTPAYERDTFHVVGLEDNYETSAAAGNVQTKYAPMVVEQPPPPMKQTSILSFFRDSLNKSPRKKTPKHRPEEYNFDEYIVGERSMDDSSGESPKRASTPGKEEQAAPNLSNCFGFDDEECLENVSPTKAKRVDKQQKKAALKSLSQKRKILSELTSNCARPTRVERRELRKILADKQSDPQVTVPSEEVNHEEKIADEQTTINSDSDNSTAGIVAENITQDDESHNDQTGLALFEDPLQVEVVHYNKPTRKSYERKRRQPVRFRENEGFVQQGHMSESDSDDSITEIIAKKLKKKKKTHKVAHKKETKEMEEWVAGFNSMIEEAEEFTLCIE